LYCVAERLSVLSTWAGRRDKMSVVRSRSRNAASSGQVARRGLFCDGLVPFITPMLLVITTYVKTPFEASSSARLGVDRSRVRARTQAKRPSASGAIQPFTLAVVPAELTTVSAEQARAEI